MTAIDLPSRLATPGALAATFGAAIQHMMRLPSPEAAQAQLAAFRPRDNTEAEYAHIILALRVALNNACHGLAAPDLSRSQADTSRRIMIALGKEIRATLAALDQRQAMPLVVADPDWDRSPYNAGATADIDIRHFTPDNWMNGGRDPVPPEQPVPAVPVQAAEPTPPTAAPPRPEAAAPAAKLPSPKPNPAKHRMHHDGLTGTFAAGDALSRFVSSRLDPAMTETEASTIALLAQGLSAGPPARGVLAAQPAQAVPAAHPARGVPAASPAGARYGAAA